MKMVSGVLKKQKSHANIFFSILSTYILPVFRKSILKRLNGYKVARDHAFEDYELFMRLHERGYKGYNLQENLLKYREDRESYKKEKILLSGEKAKVR